MGSGTKKVGFPLWFWVLSFSTPSRASFRKRRSTNPWKCYWQFSDSFVCIFPPSGNICDALTLNCNIMLMEPHKLENQNCKSHVMKKITSGWRPRMIFLSQVICNFDFPMCGVRATLLYDCAIIKSLENFHNSWPLIKKIREIYLAIVGK